MELVPFTLLLCVAGVGALVRGERIERRGALMFALAWIIGQIVRPWPGPWLFLDDLAVMIGLIALSWKSPRPWPVYACGFQILLLAAHVGGWIDPDIATETYRKLLATLSAGAILMLAMGAWLPPREMARLKTK
jgi:hypothetical protein